MLRTVPVGFMVALAAKKAGNDEESYLGVSGEYTLSDRFTAVTYLNIIQ